MLEQGDRDGIGRSEQLRAVFAVEGDAHAVDEEVELQGIGDGEGAVVDQARLDQRPGGDPVAGDDGAAVEGDLDLRLQGVGHYLHARGDGIIGLGELVDAVVAVDPDRHQAAAGFAGGGVELIDGQLLVGGEAARQGDAGEEFFVAARGGFAEGDADAVGACESDVEDIELEDDRLAAEHRIGGEVEESGADRQVGRGIVEHLPGVEAGGAELVGGGEIGHQLQPGILPSADGRDIVVIVGGQAGAQGIPDGAVAPLAEQAQGQAAQLRHLRLGPGRAPGSRRPDAGGGEGAMGGEIKKGVHSGRRPALGRHSCLRHSADHGPLPADDGPR